MLNTWARRAGRFAGLAVATLTIACGTSGGGDKSPTGPDQPTPGSITVSVGSTTANLTQGATVGLSVSISRSGSFTGDVAINAQGLPAGVSVSSLTIAAGATTGTLTLTATGTATVTTSTITIIASGTGVTSAQVSLSLTVAAASGGQTGSFSLAVSNAAPSVAQGAAVNLTITVTRAGGFSGAVNLSVTGAPAGLTPTLSSATIASGSTTATLTLTASGSLAAASYSLTITGTATGVSNQTATVSPTVTAASSGGGGNVTWTFCGAFGVPLWVAAQDGSGAWTRVTGTNDAYTFQISSGKGGVAYVLSTAASNFEVQVFYGSTSDLQTRGGEICGGTASAAKTVNGSVVGASGTDLVMLGLGRATASVVPATSLNFSLTNVGQGALDLIAGKSLLTIGGSGISFSLNKVVMRRNLSQAHNSTLAAIDFNAGDAITPATATATFGNLGADGTIIVGSYQTTNNTLASFYTDANVSTAASRSFSGIPAGSQLAGDLHVMTFSAQSAALQAPTSTRAVTLAFGAMGNKTVTFGSSATAPTVSVLGSAPYARIRAAMTLQAEYNRYWLADFQQAGASPRRVQVQMTTGYAPGATFNLDVPDFSGVAGFLNTWGLTAGTVVNWTTSVSGWEGNGGTVQGPIVNGGVYISATRMGSVTP